MMGAGFGHRDREAEKLKPRDLAKNSISPYNLPIRSFAMLVLRILAENGISGKLFNRSARASIIIENQARPLLPPAALR
jgi:hypothetical protein